MSKRELNEIRPACGKFRSIRHAKMSLNSNWNFWSNGTRSKSLSQGTTHCDWTLERGLKIAPDLIEIGIHRRKTV